MRLLIVAIVVFVVYRIWKGNQSPVQKNFDEVLEKQEIETRAVNQGILATPLLATRGEEPLTTFNAAITLPKIGQVMTTQWFPRAGEILN